MYQKELTRIQNFINFAGQTNVVNLLHNNGADISIKDKNGKTAAESTQSQLNSYCILC